MEDLTINEIIETLKQKLEAKNLERIAQFQKQLEKEKKNYLKSLRYFKHKLEKGN